MATTVNRLSEVRSREWERGTHALIGVLMMALAVASLSVALLYAIRVINERQIPFVFVDDLGLHPIDTKKKLFNPEDPDFGSPIQGVLYNNWAKNYFERRRNTITEQLNMAQLFMNVPKAMALKESIDQGMIDGFLSNTSQPEIKITRAGGSLTRIMGCGHANQQICSGSVIFNEASESKSRLCSVAVEFGFGLPDKELVNSMGLAVTDWQGPECGPYRSDRGISE